MITGLSIKAILAVIAALGVPGALWLAWKKAEDWITEKEKDDEQENLLEKLQDQRDSPITDVPAADWMWDDLKS
ncbi:MAG: hypothetical protein WBK55_08325 [Alphaproteobacteria bacterium]